MENNFKKYYLTNVYDVTEEIKDGFTERKKIEVIAEEVNGELREIFTKGKIFVVDKYQTFNSRPFLRSNSSLYGIKKEEIAYSKMLDKLQSASGDEIRSYIEQVIVLSKSTIQKALDGEKDLLLKELNFVESFNNTSYENLLDEPITKHL